MSNTDGKIGRRNGRNGSNKPQPWEPLPRDLEIHSMVCEGTQTQQQIGKKFGLSKSSVCSIAKKVDAWLIPQWMDDIRQIKSRHGESLMHVFREAMRAWERSKGDEVTTKIEDPPIEELDGENMPASNQTVTRKTTAGNPAFLSQARAALSDIRKIWGADEPVEHRHSGDIRVAGMSRNEMHAALADHYRSMVTAREN